MNSFLLVLAITLFQNGIHSASIPNHLLDEDIQSNVIEHKQDVIEGLVPPKPKAEDHYTNQLKEPTGASYDVVVSSKYLKLATTGFPSQIIRLTEKETEGIQKLSVAFIEIVYGGIIAIKVPDINASLPDWRETHPLIHLNNSGIYIEFPNFPEEEITTVNTTDIERKIVWGFLAKYGKNVLESKLKELNVTEKANITFQTSDEYEPEFKKFLDIIWRIMKVSVDYAGTIVEAWTAPSETTTVEMEDTPKYSLTTSTIFAYEEPLPRHVFPSEEFEFRRKDVDSMYYGRGII